MPRVVEALLRTSRVLFGTGPTAHKEPETDNKPPHPNSTRPIQQPPQSEHLIIAHHGRPGTDERGRADTKAGLLEHQELKGATGGRKATGGVIELMSPLVYTTSVRLRVGTERENKEKKVTEAEMESLSY